MKIQSVNFLSYNYLIVTSKKFLQEIKLDELSSQEFSLHEVNEALEYLKNPDCVKVLIKF